MARKKVGGSCVRTRLGGCGIAVLLGAFAPSGAAARDVTYQNDEVAVYVNPGEPTQVQFPGVIAGGFKKKQSAVSIEKKGGDLIVFAQESLSDRGEALIVRLEDGRSYSVRIRPSSAGLPRDTVVKIDDAGGNVVTPDASEEEEPYREKTFEYAPPTQVSGLMREMVLSAEFGKAAVTGYRTSDRYKGQTVLHDGTVHAKIDKIFIGPSLWGYVIDAENLLDQSQKVNPATFRIDGTRAVSAKQWELAPRPLDVEQNVAARHRTKVYVVTRAK